MFGGAVRLLERIPPVARLIEQRDQAVALLQKAGAFPPGHYYSPIPDEREVRAAESRIFESPAPSIPGIELNAAEQLGLLRVLAEFSSEMPFGAERAAGLRYYFENPMYSYSDGTLLHCIIRHLRPRQIVEVGSGFSSAVILDTNELFFDGNITCTFIDPEMERLEGLLRDGDAKSATVVRSQVQDVDIGLFRRLCKGDILFIDSSHVTKIGSDVNFLLFRVLPELSSGVYIHVHDMFYPFEYPKSWIYQGRAWNEAYLMRAFLQYNERFRIRLWNHYLSLFHAESLSSYLPICLRNAGASLWLEKVSV